MSRVAFIFPGQGAQKAGMGQDFYEQSEIAKEIFEKASDLLKIDMKALCFEENELLDQTEYTQAALTTTCLAMAKVVEARGLTPDITAGLSLGEYSAIAMAGGMSMEDAITTVRKRGILMQNTVPTGEGAMAAVLGMTGEAIEEVLAGREGVTIANYNCPGQLVITGKTSAVEAASTALKEAGAKRVVPLNVSGPFHSPMLKSAGEELANVLESVELSELKIPYVTNVTAEAVTDIGKTKALLAAQVASSVRWEQSVRNMIADGVDTFVEIGPGRTLAGFLRKIDRSVSVYNIQAWDDVDKVLTALQEGE
ncbi:MAG: ACP S-malonyltransferase [Hespellia sp.]|nr:ACP S-malonyltransferase [Hespellia sp.]